MLCYVRLVNQSRDDMTVLEREVVVRPINVRRHETRDARPGRLIDDARMNLGDALGVGVPLVRKMGRPFVERLRSQSLGEPVGEDARREHRHDAPSAALCRLA